MNVRNTILWICCKSMRSFTIYMEMSSKDTVVSCNIIYVSRAFGNKPVTMLLSNLITTKLHQVKYATSVLEALDVHLY